MRLVRGCFWLSLKGWVRSCEVGWEGIEVLRVQIEWIFRNIIRLSII